MCMIVQFYDCGTGMFAMRTAPTANATFGVSGGFGSSYTPSPRRLFGLAIDNDSHMVHFFGGLDANGRVNQDYWQMKTATTQVGNYCFLFLFLSCQNFMNKTESMDSIS